jgi:hypothetical protein
MVMKRPILLGISAVLLAGLLPVACQTTPTLVRAQQEVRETQDVLIQAYLKRDGAALDRVLADEYVFTNDQGKVVNKAATLAMFASGERTISSYNIDDAQVFVYNGAAVMIYHYTSKEQYKGRADDGQYRLTRVFVRRSGRWQIVAGQETRVAGQ